MFKKKVWKRGDKLNAKELNRIENGIADGGNVTTVSVDVDATNMTTTGLSYSNWSITPEELKNLCKKAEKINLIINVFGNAQKIQTIYTSSNDIEGYNYTFLVYMKGIGLTILILKYNTDTNEIQGSTTPKILIPDPNAD